ncbi:MAG: hypothetical protein QOK15_724 [Nocardioidaceae bacterium]|nr:hypothetical protein [Nocardioidaceae bacterium]
MGLPKSGTTFLQALLAKNRGRLKENGFIYPFIRRECMFHAAVELRQQYDRWGLPPERIDGTWDQLLDRVRAFGGDGIISHEVLAGASADHVARVARDTSDLELHVVVTARDLARQVAAYWQETVKNGRRSSFDDFWHSLTDSAESTHEEAGFWRSQDLASVLRRWGAGLPPEQLHVVVVPQPGADRFELWRRFADALGLDPGALDLELETQANESLGAAQVALLRQVLTSLDGRLGQPHYAHVVKRFFAQNLLSRIESPRAVTPPELREDLAVSARRWSEEIETHGYQVHGRLDELLPAERSGGSDRHPDDVSCEDMYQHVPDVLAEMLIEIATLRTQIKGPRALPPLAAGSAEATGPEPATAAEPAPVEPTPPVEPGALLP